MSDFIKFDDLFEEVDLPVPLSPLPPTPVSSSRPMSPAEIPELYFGKSVEESPERSPVESVAQSLEPCSTKPRAASPRPVPSMAKPTVVQRKTDPPRRKRSRSKEAKSLPNGAAPMKGKAPTDLLLPMPGPTIPDLKRPDCTIPDLKRPDHMIPDLKRPDRMIPDLQRPDHGISKPQLVIFMLLGDVSFLRVGKKPVPKFFSTTTGWRSLVAATMDSRSPTASCPTLRASGASRP
ncbi:hypothetical protein NPIL_605441 [Nephila pilipes]|uniref:Uncharacterized protein n=1 Tax=Nephila pilipes TaxID=299642 RepID=A0A8X6PE04_NEPPI|nr:hypothetical protein NPIL_286571 [Nephila pilipes]GFU25553.1 hypothetical protein NPIL_605441 [Nephila pilipes]